MNVVTRRRKPSGHSLEIIWILYIRLEKYLKQSQKRPIAYIITAMNRLSKRTKDDLSRSSVYKMTKNPSPQHLRERVLFYIN